MSRGPLLRREGVDRQGRPYLVRPAGPDDAAAVARLRGAVTAEGRWLLADTGPGETEVHLQLASLLHGGGLSLALEVDGEVVGECSVSRRRGPEQHVGELSIAIAEGHRERGLGSTLLQVAVDWARAVGLRKLVLAVLAGNDRAVAAYRSAGFREEGVLRGQVHARGEDLDLVLMGRGLGG